MLVMIALIALLGVGGSQNTATQGADRAVHKQGTVELMSNGAVDIDEGRAWTTHCEDCKFQPEPKTKFKDADFWFQALLGKRQYLHPENGAMLARTDNKGAGYSGCVAATYSAKTLRLDTLAAGAAICVRTDVGRYAEIRVESFDAKTTRLSLTYISWEKDGEGAAGKQSQ